jgi:hypothetical protein
MSEQVGFALIVSGILILAIGQVWMIIRGFRASVIWGVLNWAGFGTLLFPFFHWKLARIPLAIILLGSGLAAAPLIATQLQAVDLGPLDRDVNGERHLTLTGWDRKDYSVIAARSDTIVLQMANPDVTDETLSVLKGLSRLREVDLTDTKVTDAGLPALAALPALTSIRLRNCAISDEAFRAHLLNKSTLTQLDLRGTQIKRETVNAWKAAKPGRKAMGGT